ncbi:hypothetical protein [Sulfurimonas sp.]|jgi:hypothetical protein|uniref:hypothetical protein n=1 Tax=Sulfurimonas sp. TaxID=2022749 RepID=UPI0025CFB3B4|nr:hypothetical protein [Sulfurimonas sp.]MBT5934425.1 hypothetical protein [Sulfurimonas sp.]
MKKTLLILTLILSTHLLCDELAWVNEQIEAIKPPRNGMKQHVVSGLKDPFIFLVKKTKNKVKVEGKVNVKSKVKKVSKVISLTMVINKKAMINGKWYRSGDLVNGYRVKTISTKSVLLVKSKKQLLLSVKTNSKKLNFKNK